MFFHKIKIMFTVIFGIILIAFAVFAALPAGIGLGWGSEILFVLKGALPVLAVLFGIFVIFIGVADINDRREAKREEEEAEKADSNEKQGKKS